MSSRNRAGRSHSRRFFWLAVFIVVAILAYTGAWFYFAREIELRTESALTRLTGSGIAAGCEEGTARGYPFRIGMFCERVFYDNPAGGVSVEAGAFRSAAQVYAPWHVVGELDGPAMVEIRSLPPLTIDWELLHASTRLARPLPERISVEGKAITVSARESEPKPLASAEAGEFHARPSGPDLDVAGLFTGLTADPSLVKGLRLPELDGSADMTIKDGIALVRKPPTDLRGRSVTIRTLSVSSAGGDAGVTLSGPLSVDEKGRIDAELNVSLRNPREISRLLEEAFPERRDEIRTAFSAIGALGDTPSFPLRIERGKAYLGFIPLGRIPPL